MADDLKLAIPNPLDKRSTGDCITLPGYGSIRREEFLRYHDRDPTAQARDDPPGLHDPLVSHETLNHKPARPGPSVINSDLRPRMLTTTLGTLEESQFAGAYVVIKPIPSKVLRGVHCGT